MESITRYLQETQRVLAETTEKPIKKVVSLLFDAWKLRKQVFIFGNGGSASTASHMANDLSKATIVVGKPRLRVIALTDNVSIITAWANDISYEAIFKEQLENLMQPGDLVIGISAAAIPPMCSARWSLPASTVPSLSGGQDALEAPWVKWLIFAYLSDRGYWDD